MLKKINQTAESIRGKITDNTEYGIVLGSGLGGLVKEIEIKVATSAEGKMTSIIIELIRSI